MNIIKKSALFIAVLMLALTFASCAAPVPTITVTVKANAGSIPLFEYKTVKVEKEAPVAVDAINSAIDKYSLNIEFIEDSTRVISLVNGGVNYKETTVGDVTYFWSFTVNGEQPEAGDGAKITTHKISDGDVIALEFYKSDNISGTVVKYDPDNDYQFDSSSNEDEGDEDTSADEGDIDETTEEE